MDLSIHRVRRIFVTEKYENANHHYLVIQTKDGETLKIDLYGWNGEIDYEQWGEGCLA